MNFKSDRFEQFHYFRVFANSWDQEIVHFPENRKLLVTRGIKSKYFAKVQNKARLKIIQYTLVSLSCFRATIFKWFGNKYNDLVLLLVQAAAPREACVQVRERGNRPPLRQDGLFRCAAAGATPDPENPRAASPHEQALYRHSISSFKLRTPSRGENLFGRASEPSPRA